MVSLILNRWLEDPTIEDMYRKSVFVEGTMYVLDVVDTAGQEELTATSITIKISIKRITFVLEMDLSSFIQLTVLIPLKS